MKGVKLSLPTPWRPQEVEVYLHSFLTSALDGGKFSTLRLGRFAPGKETCTYLLGAWMGPRAGLICLGEEKNLFPLPGFETRIVQTVAQSQHRPRQSDSEVY